MEGVEVFGAGWLTLLVALPAATGFALASMAALAAVFGLPRLPLVAWRATAFIASTSCFGLAVWLAIARFDPEQLGLQVFETIRWAPDLGLDFSFALDGIGLCFVSATAALVPLAMASAWGGAEPSERERIFATLWAESALLGTMTSTNLLAFVGCWTLGLLPILLWLARFGGVGRERAASRIWAVESIAAAALLFVVFSLHAATTRALGAPTLDLVGHAGTPAGLGLLDVPLPLADQRLLFAVFGIALATRLPVVPFHFWLPAAQAAAPTGLSVLIATGFVQTAAIGALRFALPLFPDAAVEAGPLLSVLGIVAFAYASLIALVQKELKRLVAYASVGHAGFALFGLSTLNVQGLTGAVLQLLAHGLATAGLLTLIGFLALRRGTTQVAAFGGLAKPMPVCAFFFTVMVFSLLGVPMLGGFVGDLFVLFGSLETRRALSVFALLAMVVAASYLLWVQRRLFLGPVEAPENRGLIDLDGRERAILLAITLPIVALGVHPNPVLRRVEPAVLELLHHMERRSVVPPPISEEEPTDGGMAVRPGSGAGRRLARAGLPR